MTEMKKINEMELENVAGNHDRNEENQRDGT